MNPHTKREAKLKLLDAVINYAFSEGAEAHETMIRVAWCQKNFVPGVKIDRLKPIQIALDEMRLELEKAEYKRAVLKAYPDALKAQLDA